jgi:predicted N-acetyltransferase YhbS
MRSDYEVRVARLEDAAALDRLLQASYPILMGPSYDEESLAPALKLMTNANPSLLASGTYYVAEMSTGLLIGSGGWTRERPGEGTVEPHLGHLRHFAVNPGWTRRGIGSAIYGLCEGAARAAGVSAFDCYSTLNAEKFYRALGFKRIHEMEIELQPRVFIRGVLMRREF